MDDEARYSMLSWQIQCGMKTNGKTGAHHYRRPSSGCIWRRSLSGAQLRQLLEWWPPCGKTGTQCHRPSGAHTREDTPCKTCGGTEETWAGGHDRQTDCDRSGTSACVRSSP